ncbi:PREDICTED: uncharacterized protein LOC105964806 [Erythranthe guttata]|uniref:uncharacterized protein LOC105964806 n=1 Tax=Erythranthe guttata TaxID=4155 RepID=UPI00064D954C|nr:PREDICTED: uncharacterized protein LOC105964806 [Erythranthe guttata]|eukprot:XP_012844766.1 PREDICTED: uncharacterized protein LOC105964806 [Erythranthe guttata]
MAMKEGDGMQSFLSKVAEIVNQIRSLGDVIEECKIVQKILRSLPAKFDHVVAAIEESKNLSTYTFNELMSSLQVHEERLNRSSNQPVDQAFQSKLHISDKKSSRWQGGKGCFNNKGKRQGKFFKGGKEQQSENSFSGCRICKKSNHETKNCFFRCKSCKDTDHSYSKCPRKNKDDKDEANFSKHEEDQLFSCINGQKEFENVWYVDSTCSNHMCGDRSIFVEIDTNHYSKIKLGDGSILEAKGKGAIDVNKKGSNQKLIKDVLFVPSITQNY